MCGKTNNQRRYNENIHSKIQHPQHRQTREADSPRERRRRGEGSGLSLGPRLVLARRKKGDKMSLVGLLMIAAFAYMTCDVIGTAIEKNKERRGE